jgi:uncharacterized membrane protein
MTLNRTLRHLFTDERAVRRAFPRGSMQAIELAITEQERRHYGELRFALEASLPWAELMSGVSARERAIDWFGRLRVWDTEHNSGVLIYVLLAEKQVEIVADRGIDRKVDAAVWQKICSQMEHEFAQGQFERGAVLGLQAIGELLATHFPAGEGANPNELPDQPVVV